MKPLHLTFIVVGAFACHLTEAGYSGPGGDDEDDFATDIRGYGSPGPMGQIAAIVIPSQAPKSSVKPSGYARPEISQDEDWDFDVKPYGGNQRGPSSSGASNYGPTVAPRRPAAPYGPSKSASGGWTPMAGPSAPYGPAKPPAAGGWSPNNSAPPKPSYGSNVIASGGWSPSNAPNSQGFSGGWESSGPTVAPKRHSASYGPGHASNGNNGWSQNNAGAAKSSFGQSGGFGASNGWSPANAGPAVTPRRPQTSYGPASKPPAAGGWSPPNAGGAPFGGYGGSSGWSPAGSGPTVAPKRSSASYGPNKTSGGNGGVWTQSGPPKSSFGSHGGPNSGGGWSPAGQGPTVAPKRPHTSYGPSPHSAAPAAGGWPPSNAGSAKSSYAPTGSSNFGGGWTPDRADPTVDPRRHQSSYGPGPNPAAGPSFHGGTAKSSFTQNDNSWGQAGASPTVAPRRPQASYGPASKPAAAGGWAGPATTSYAPSNGHSSPSGWSSAGAAPTVAPRRPSTSYGPPNGSNAAKSASGPSWTPEEDQPSYGAPQKKPHSHGAPPRAPSAPASVPKRPTSSYGAPAQPAPTNEGWSPNNAGGNVGGYAPSSGQSPEAGWSDAEPGSHAQRRPSSSYGAPASSDDSYDDHQSGGHGGAAMPYEFSYNADLNDGNIYREERGDDTGRVVGVYTIRTNEGINRKVKYMADQTGFHAEIDTNEPGTASKNPADVIFRSTAPQDVQDAPGAHHHGNSAAGYENHSQLSNARAQGGSGGGGGGYGNPNAGGWEE